MTGQYDEIRGEILLEFTKVGKQVRVAAIHAPTGTEVVTIAPVSATKQQMQQVAISKLKRRLKQLTPSPLQQDSNLY